MQITRAGRDGHAMPGALVGLLLLCLLAAEAGAQSRMVTTRETKKRQCQTITIPMCKDIGYNLTYMPNEFNHETQEEAGLEVHQFWPLVTIHCSEDLRFFLCSMYTPICMTDYHQPLPVCRSVCQRARSGCAPLMRQYGFHWPDRMACEKLPEFGDPKQLCMDVNHTRSTQRPPSKKCQCTCNKPMVPMTLESAGENRGHFNRVTTGNVPNCVLPCHSPHFPKEDRVFATLWIGLWSVLCCVSTLATVSTFLVDMERFKYPERPLIFLSGCYFMVSLGYIVRLIVGHEKLACDGDMIRYGSTGPAQCSIVFLLIYFFGMASSIWWVILTVTWFLAAGLKWGSEAIARYSQVFHFVAWFLPGAKSITVLTLSAVDGDPVGGICYVGNTSTLTLNIFVLGPLFLYLILGTIFLLSGFVSLFRIRNVIKAQGDGKTDKLEKLMIRIGIFSVLYTVPATVVISCYFYEQHFRDRWETAHNCPCKTDKSQPEYSMFMLKYFMCLVVGITSGFWIWTGKTLESWRYFFYRIGCASAPAPSAASVRSHYKYSPPPGMPVGGVTPAGGPGLGSGLGGLAGQPGAGLGPQQGVGVPGGMVMAPSMGSHSGHGMSPPPIALGLQSTGGGSAQQKLLASAAPTPLSHV